MSLEVIRNSLAICGFYFQVKSSYMSVNKPSKMFKIRYGTIWNKANGKHSRKIGSQCYISSSLDKVVVESFEQLADWKVPFDTYAIRCLLKEYRDSSQSFNNTHREKLVLY